MYVSQDIARLECFKKAVFGAALYLGKDNYVRGFSTDDVHIKVDIQVICKLRYERLLYVKSLPLYRFIKRIASRAL